MSLSTLAWDLELNKMGFVWRSHFANNGFGDLWGLSGLLRCSLQTIVYTQQTIVYTSLVHATENCIHVGRLKVASCIQLLIVQIRKLCIRHRIDRTCSIPKKRVVCSRPCSMVTEHESPSTWTYRRLFKCLETQMLPSS